MKFEIEPDRLKRYLAGTMICKGGKPSYDPGIIVFDGAKATTFGMYGVAYGTYQEHKKEFFLNYKCEEREVIPISEDINKKLGWGFNDDKITVETIGDEITFTGKKDKFKTTLENAEPNEKHWDFKETDIGFVPVFNYQHNPEWDKKTVDIRSVFEVEKEELKLPPSNEYELIFDSEGLTVRIPDGGDFNRKITGKVIQENPITVKVDAVFFSTIVENLNGKIKLALSEKMILFLESRKDYNATYFLGTLLE